MKLSRLTRRKSRTKDSKNVGDWIPSNAPVKEVGVIEEDIRRFYLRTNVSYNNDGNKFVPVTFLLDTGGKNFLGQNTIAALRLLGIPNFEDRLVVGRYRLTIHDKVWTFERFPNNLDPDRNMLGAEFVARHEGILVEDNTFTMGNDNFDLSDNVLETIRADKSKLADHENNYPSNWEQLYIFPKSLVTIPIKDKAEIKLYQQFSGLYFRPWKTVFLPTKGKQKLIPITCLVDLGSPGDDAHIHFSTAMYNKVVELGADLNNNEKFKGMKLQNALDRKLKGSNCTFTSKFVADYKGILGDENGGFLITQFQSKRKTKKFN